ncbi:stage VI sporulation protein D [Virgibacillus ndiopensis]|uniref:stage VI sporulation protein D n=1 Tax=Virgibacillus ndiopensis TaxID=2004408 RepID=UPI000C071528|nr:stage VI sporulation protein D [Virgibacillus ndiopensis]
MSNDQSVFSFDLNESLYFERGQEVAEMMGISLDPEISIQAFNEYISIRGVIELRGEYVKANNYEEESDTLEFDDYQSRRYVESVIDSESGATEFSHRFPVEISVPTYRVGDLDDVTVSIESFDYEIPNSSQLKLMSTVAIHGISDQSESSRQEESYDGMDFAEPLVDSANSDTFEFDIKESNQDRPEEKEINDFSNVPTLANDYEQTDVEEQEVHENEKERWKQKKSQTLAEFFKKDPEPDSVTESPYVESPVMDNTESDDFYEDDESRSNDVQDVRYLSEIFRSDEEEKFTKMRMCIVQEKDTIEKIANRYKIPTLQLVKQNRLQDENLTEGQLLYIPNKNK